MEGSSNVFYKTIISHRCLKAVTYLQVSQIHIPFHRFSFLTQDCNVYIATSSFLTQIFFTLSPGSRRAKETQTM